MLRWVLLLLCGLLAAPILAAGVEIVDLPTEVDARYDLTWDMIVDAPPLTPLQLDVEKAADGSGYLLRFEKGKVICQQTGAKASLPPIVASCTMQGNARYAFSLKRRPDKMALLMNHRLLLCAPAPRLGGAGFAFRGVPSGSAVVNARYHNIDRQIFGDDFMRTEAARRVLTNPTSWVEDDTWKVAHFLKDWPGQSPKDPKSGAPMLNPWQLSVFQVISTSTNGFWLLYRGVGPSWVIASPQTVYPTWDSYYFESAVRPEYDSIIGIIAAFQDNKNYLLFRWKQREYTTENTGAPRAELIAMIDGRPTVLASSPRGFDPTQWYNLRINLDWQRVQALVDGEVLLDAKNPGNIEGRVGLYADCSSNPKRPPVDEVTAQMYVTTDDAGHTTNDAADAMRTSSMVYFDDVRVGDLTAVPDLLTGSQYATTTTGVWKTDGDALVNKVAGQMIAGPLSWLYDAPTKNAAPRAIISEGNRYIASVDVQIPSNGNAGLLFGLNASSAGYGWVVTPSGQRLCLVDGGKWSAPIDTSLVKVSPGEWAHLTARVDGAYVSLFYNNQRVMENIDPQRLGGRCGIFATTPGAQFRNLSVTVPDPVSYRVVIHDSFNQDKWLITWASAESDWYPAFIPAQYITPGVPPLGAIPHAVIGPASPLPTETPGLYWHKGGNYGDLRVLIPISRETLNGQTVYLATNYNPKSGYQVNISPGENGGQAQLMRNEQAIGVYPFTLSPKMRLIFARRGNYLLLINQTLDAEDTGTEPIVQKEQLVFAYRDRQPLHAEMVGFNVTTQKLPAAKIIVESNRLQDTFETSPIHWLVESGVWAVMNRFSCQPWWNWFGGFGPNTPTVWCKYRLDGDQTFESYTGVKMQFDNMTEEYQRRYRDMNVTICADGSHLNSGYSVIRNSHPGGRTVTLLMRKDVVVKESTDPTHLLPQNGIGHRMWFATRIEKRGKEIKVFLDNKLAMTYVDPDPLPGGYAGVWTLNNGIMVGRVNLSAEKMTMGMPRAAAPLAIQENIENLPTPQLTMNDVPVAVATFEDGLDGWKERPGFTGRLVRERVADALHGSNTYLKVVNTYPAGDCSVNVTSEVRDLRATPVFHLDYCFDPGTMVNLYVRKDETLYEFRLTGKEAQEPNVFTVPGQLFCRADGRWHHLEYNLGDPLDAAITKRKGAKPTDLRVSEIILADWSSSADARYFGFGLNSGGTVMRFDNSAFTPVVTGPVTVKWTSPEGGAFFRTGLDNQPYGMATRETNDASFVVPVAADLRFFHVQAKRPKGNYGPIVHLPISAWPKTK